MGYLTCCCWFGYSFGAAGGGRAGGCGDFGGVAIDLRDLGSKYMKGSCLKHTILRVFYVETKVF